ncbi:MAG: hypothetical protein NTW29_19345 [Bacteroidetes bacterium]|nr:hypothetical protein [Bacteroidota bacterium]
MKPLLILALGLLSLQGMAQTAVKRKSVPDEVITSDSISWTISTLSSVGYVNTTPGPYYNSYKSGGGMLVKFNFKKNGRFSFQLYVQANSYGTDTETWTETEGTVEFKKDAKGQDIFVTKAEKGVYRVTKNGRTTSRPIPRNELMGQHSQTFLWQKTTFSDDPNHIYLLMVDMEEHPEADVNNPSTIKPEWVSKFHIPAK